MIRVYDAVGNVIETHEHKGDFKEWSAFVIAQDLLVFFRFLWSYCSPVFNMAPLGQLKIICRFVQIACLAFAALNNLPNANAGFTFTPGHIYTLYTNIGSRDIFEDSETGTFPGSLTPPSLVEDDELRGIAFGPDGFLYAVKLHFAQSGFRFSHSTP